MSEDLTTGIVRILTADGTTAGTGFVTSYAAAGGSVALIVTCAHVVEAAGAGPGDSVRVAFHATGEEREAQVEPAWWRGPDAEDVAILRLKEPLPEWVTPLLLGSSAGVEGHALTTFGFPDPKPVEGMAGKCEVVGRTTERGFPVLQLRSSETTPGFSGAPVWDEQLHVVIGMVTSITAPDQYGRQQETAFIIPVETLRAACPAIRLPEGCPYRDLQAFEAEHADLYFGREEATRELLDILSRRDFVALVGVSGSGKSSLMRAGLEKGLREHAIPGLVERSRCLAVPGHSPLLNLALALADVEGITAADVTEAFDLPEDALAEGERRQTADVLNTRSPQALADAVRACAPSEGLLVIVDQFERLYTECDDEAVRNRFIDALLAAAGGRVKVLLALRADYYGLALEHPGLEQVVKQGGQVTLGRMIEADLRAAIEEPARAMGRSLQPGLAEQLIADVHERAGDLPLLEFALTELWERDNQRGVLTLATYEALGYEAPNGRCFRGVQGAIARRAEAVWQGLDDEERRAARRVFLNLVTPGPLDERGERMAEDASRRAWQAEWDKTTRRVVGKLVDARLLTTGQDPVSGQPMVELAHEALIRAWPRLQQWLADYRPFVRWYDAELAPFLRRWLDKERHPDFLLPEAMLAQAEHWLRRYPEELSGPPEAYIQASLEKQEQEQAARERLRRRIILGLASGLLLALALAVAAGLGWQSSATNENALETQVAVRETAQAEAEVAAIAEAQARQDAEVAATAEAEARQDAERQADIALSRQLANQSTNELDKLNYEVALLLAIEAGRASDTAEAFTALRQAIAHRGRTLTILSDPVYGFSQANWNASGSRILTVGCKIELVPGKCPDNILRVWDTETGTELVTLSDSKHGISQAGWNADGTRILTIGCEVRDHLPDYRECPGSMVRVWDAETGAELVTLSGHGIDWAIWNANETRILTTSDDTVQVWDAETGAELIAFSPHTGWNINARWNADESRILTRSGSTIQVWDTETGAELVALSVPSDQVNKVVWNAKGTRFLTLRHDGTVQVWDAETGAELVTLYAHTRQVNQASWNTDGTRFLTQSVYDKAVRVWDAETGAELAVLSGHETSGVWQASWSADGSRILTQGYDSVRVWEVETGAELVTLSGRNIGLSIWNATETRILTGIFSSPVRLWDAESGTELATLSGYIARDSWESWKADGRHILTVGYDGTVRVWDAETGAELAVLSGHTDRITQATWNDDGTRILTRSDDNTVRVWSIESGVELPILSGHTDRVERGSWNADDTRILTKSSDGTARLWDSKSGAELLVAHLGQSYEMVRASWIFDGARVIARSNDGTVKVWNAESGAKLIDLSEDMSGAGWTTWTDAGRTRLFIRSDDDTLRIWDVETKTELMRLSGPEYDGWARYNADGTRILTRGQDGTVRVWDIESGTELATLSGNTSDVTHAVWNPDGTRIFIGNTDDTTTIWDADSGTQLATLPVQTDSSGYTSLNTDGTYILTRKEDSVQVWDIESGARLAVSFSYVDRYPHASWNADGTRILTFGCKRRDEDGTCIESIAQVWDVETETELITLTSHSSWFTYAVWNTDETRLITLSNTDILQMWDVENGAELAVLSDHDTGLEEAVLNADETRLLTVSWGNPARLWDVEYGVELVTFPGRVLWGDLGLGFVNADESRLLIASEDGTVRQYYIWMEDLLAAACQRAPRNMTREEWQRFMKHEEFHSTCPNLPAPDAFQPTPFPIPSPTPAASPTSHPAPSLTPTSATQPFISPLPAPMNSPLTFDSPLSASPAPSVSPSPTPLSTTIQHSWAGVVMLLSSSVVLVVLGLKIIRARTGYRRNEPHCPTCWCRRSERKYPQ